MQSRKRRNTISVPDASRKVASKVLSYLGSDMSSDIELSRGTDLPSLIGLDLPVDEFRAKYLASELMSKFPDLETGVDKTEVAIAAFLKSEDVCYDTNCRLQRCSSIFGVDAVIMTASRLLASLLGDTLDLNEMARYVSFTSGASTRLRRVRSLPPMKYSVSKNKLHVTASCLPYAIASVRSSPVWERLLIAQTGSSDPIAWFEVVEGNRVTTVPKNAKTDRIIAIEPCMNMYVQKGIGKMIRSRLRRVGVNLNSQVKNQQLAYEGSLRGDLATIDLSAASDSISVELCRLLLPSDWFRHVMATRSPVGALPDGTVIRYSKVSSMGNGYTFELESMLFWALTKATMLVNGHKERRIAIYGDDIICGTEYVDRLFEVFDYVGFTINRHKSYWHGPFRESCGKHFYRGVDVTPFYVRHPINSVVQLYKVCNRFREWATRPLGFGSEASMQLWAYLCSIIPRRWRFIIPDGLGDAGIVGTLSEAPIGKRKRVIGLIPEVKRIAPGAELMYIWTLDSIRERYTLTESCPADTDSEAVSKAVPDRYKLNRYRLVGWTDPNPWIGDLEGPVGLV